MKTVLNVIKIVFLVPVLLLGCSNENSPDQTLIDHLQWSRTDSGDRRELSCVVWFKDRFIIGGRGGLLKTSTDGKKWQDIETDSETDITDLEVGEGVVLASTSTNEILRSKDGTKWASYKDLIDSEITNLVWTGESFVGASYDAFYVSLDGLKWQRVPFTGMNDSPRLSWDSEHVIADSYTYSNNIAVEVVKISRDGLVWHDVSIKKYRPTSTPWNGKKYAAKNGGAWIYEKVENGKWNVVWQPKGIILPDAFLTESFAGSKTELVAVGDHIAWTKNGKNWYSIPTGLKSGWLKKIAYGNRRYIAVGDYGSIVLGTYK